jgi:hypothetical protein
MLAMASDDTYNGWTNRETWLASLWLNNDREGYDLLLTATNQPGTMFAKADWLEQQMREALDERYGIASLWFDLVDTAFYRIDWVEVVENN